MDSLSEPTNLKCLNCEKEYPPEWMFKGCPLCKTDTFVSNLSTVYDLKKISKRLTKKTFTGRVPTMWKYWELLPVKKKEDIVTLGEGMTPLIKLERLGSELNLKHLYVKDESKNPTWSFKDRLCSSLTSKAKEFGFKVTTISSTGNHGASAAAYAARAGMDCVIFTIARVPQTMKTLMQIFEGKLVATETYSERWQIMNECIEKFGWALVGDYAAPLMVGVNPYGIDGYKTMAFEMCEQLDWKSPDLIVEPTGYANGITGVWQGFNEFYELDFIDSTPRIIAAERFGPLKNALEKQLQFPEPVELEPSVAVSIAGNISSFQGLKTITESGGFAETVTDQEVLSMQKKLGQEGIYAEAASVASLAVIKKLVEQGKIDQDEVVIAIVTSGGLKDPDVTRKILPEVPLIKPDMQELSAALKNVYNFQL